MNVSGSVKLLCTAALLAVFAGCVSPEHKGHTGVAGKTNDANTLPRSIPDGEVRAVWIASSYFNNEKQKAIPEIRTALDRFAAIEVNDIFCFHAMKYQNEKGWDFLETLLSEAHARGIRVHPCWCPGHVYPSWKQEVVEEHPEWLIQNLKENPHTLNFAIEEVREFVLSKVSEVLEYDIDGLQLDGIRFQTGQGFSYDEATCSAFKEQYGKGPQELRWHNCGSMLWCEWMRWNADHVTTMVRGIKSLIEESGKGIPLSVAVFPDHESAKLLIGQDWENWAEEGIVDILCPMLYTGNHEVFRKYAKRATNVAKGRCLLYNGILLSGPRGCNTPKDVVRQVIIARQEGADGVVFFYGGDLLKDEFFDELKVGVFSEK